MRKALNLVLGILAIAGTIGCGGCKDNRNNVAPVSEEQLRRELIEHNKFQHKAEKERIQAFVDSVKWPMQETGTGLRYWIYETSSGIQAKEGDRAFITYTVSMLNGEELYRTDANKPGQFTIGQDNVETGLHEAIQLMRLGDKAKLILPSHLAFGLTGDSEKIPQKATLLYDIQLIQLY
jgi:FKBP-type peptidyl-prolyl cis-trans isomerase